MAAAGSGLLGGAAGSVAVLDLRVGGGDRRISDDGADVTAVFHVFESRMGGWRGPCREAGWRYWYGSGQILQDLGYYIPRG